MATQISRRDRMKDFPCTFNLQWVHPTRQLLQHMKQNLSTDKPTGKYCKLEETRNKNLLTWVEHLLEPLEDKAKEINDDVMTATGNANIPSIGNRVFLLYAEGNDIDAEEYINTLEALKKRPDFEDLMTEAKAEQAYYYSRMGAFDMSVKLFQEVVNKKPLNLLWKYGLGLMYRRMTNVNVCYSVTTVYNLSELISLATGCLQDVTNSDDPQLRGLAYTQLIVMLNTYSTNKHVDCFQGFNGDELCDKALKDAADNPTVLCNCGKYFKNSDVDRSIQLIEKSLSIRKNTIAFHYLGICYEEKAEKLAMDCLSPNEKHLQKYCRTQSPFNLQSSKNLLDPNCSLVQSSEKSYKEAIMLSKKRNIPSILSLGKLYQRSNRFKQALQQFRQIIHLEDTKVGYLVALITAYEGAGICLQELRKIDQEKSQEFYVQGREYFTKAISLAADLASMKSGPKQCRTFVWKSFEILKDDIDRMDECKDKSKEYIRLLKLIRDYRGIVTAIEYILKSETKLDDPEMVLCAVNSYLEMGEYENALTFVNMIELASASGLKETEKMAFERSRLNELQAAIAKVFLFVAWERLRKQSSDAKRIFQKLFATKYGVCAEMRSEKETKDTASKADILIVNDTFQDCEEGLSLSTRMAKQLKRLFYQVFGFKSVRNLEENNEFNCNEMELLCEEMKSYHSVVLVLTEEERDPLFNHMLQTLPEIRDHTNKPINVFIIQSSERVIIPDMLLSYKQRRFTLPQDNPILSFKETDECLDEANSSDRDQASTACLDVTNSSCTEQTPTECLDVTNSSDLDQVPTACLDVTSSSDIDQVPTKCLDVTNSSDLDQVPTACLDVTSSSDIDQVPTACLDVTSSSDIDQVPTACLDVTSSSDIDQVPTACLDVTSLSDIDQVPTACLDVTSSSDIDQVPTACLDVTSSSDIDQAPTACLDLTSSSDIDQVPTACLDVTSSSDIDQVPTACLDVTSSSDIDQVTTACLDVASSSDIDQVPTACLDVTSSSDIDQVPTECLDVTSSSDIDQVPTACLDVTSSSDIDQVTTACLDVASSSDIDQVPTACLDVTSSSDIDQVPTECLDVTSSSDIDQVPTACLDVTSSSDIDQVPTACLDVTSSSDIDQVTTACLDVTSLSDLDQVPTACLDVTSSSDTDQVPTACLDVTSSSDIDQVITACLDVASSSDIDQVPTACLDVTSSSDIDQVPTACLDVTSSSDIDQVPTACLDVTSSSDIDQVTNACLDVTSSSNTEQGQTACLDVRTSRDIIPELNPQVHQNDVVLDRIISLVCFLLHLDFSQLSNEYSKCKNFT